MTTALTEHKIDDAIRYAMRHAPITEIQCTEEGDFEVEITQEECVKDFVMAVLRDLGVTA